MPVTRQTTKKTVKMKKKKEVSFLAREAKQKERTHIAIFASRSSTPAQLRKKKKHDHHLLMLSKNKSSFRCNIPFDGIVKNPSNSWIFLQKSTNSLQKVNQHYYNN